MRSGQSLAWRAFAALCLMMVFFTLALAAAGALTWSGLKIFSLLGSFRGIRGHIFLVLLGSACLGAAGVVLWSLWPRIDRFEAPGPELTQADAPELFREIDDLARATGQQPPAHVYVVHRVNAFVTERGGVMGLGSRRVMGVGLPLLELLTVAELRAVIAHELGHFHGGDTKLGPWIYKTRSTIGRTIMNLAQAQLATAEHSEVIGFVMAVVRAPFGWFGTAFLRITQAISRAQEYGADALAVRVAGSAPLIEGLKKVHGGGTTYSIYLANEVLPLVDAGYRPPILAGYRRFVGKADVASIAPKAIELELDEGEHDAFDSHPPLRDRIAAAEAIGGPEVRVDPRRAIDLLVDAEAIESAVAEHMLVGHGRLDPIEWEETAHRVLEPMWRRRIEQDRAVLVGLDPATLPRTTTELRTLAETAMGERLDDVDGDDLRGWATGLFGAALCVTLVERGWTATNEPGSPIELRCDDRRFEPYREVSRYLEGDVDAEQWRAMIVGVGLEGVALTTGATASS